MKYDVESIKRRKNISNRIKKIVFIFMVIVLYNIILLYMSYVDKYETPSFYIYKAYGITTSSMDPKIKKGDVIIIKRCNQDDLKVGDIITFKKNAEIITHRIVEIIGETEEKAYITKGDNNNVEDDEYVYLEEIEGKVIITIPYLGSLLSTLRNGIIIILVILICLIMYLNRVGMKEKSEARREKKKIEDSKFLGEQEKN